MTWSSIAIQTVELSNGGPTPQQTALAIVLLIGFFGALLAAGYLIQFVGLPGRQRREKKVFIGQKENQNPNELRIEDGDDPFDHLDDVRSLFSGDPPDVEYPNLRMAAGVVREEFGENWHSYATSIPRLARWLVELAFGFTITAAIVHVSMGTFERIFNAGGGPMRIDELVADVLWGVEEVVTLAGDALGLFPYLDFLWALAFAYAVQALQWLFNNPVPILVLLVATAAGVVWLDRRAPGARSVQMRSDRSDIITAAASFLLVWAAGALPAAAFSFIGFPSVGGIGGFLLALGIAGWLGHKAVLGTVERVRRGLQVLDDESREALAYLVIRRVGASVAAVAALLIPTYMLSALVTGKLADVIGAFLAGSVEVQMAVGLLVLFAIGLAAWAVRDAFPNVRIALQSLASKSAIRVAVFGRGAPIIAMTVVYFLAVGFGLNWLLGVALSLVAGVLARLAYQLFRRVRYRVSEVELPDMTPNMVLVQAYQLKTTKGDIRYYADVNTVSVAHEDPDALAREICDVADDLLEVGETEPSIPSAFAEDLLRFGKVDLDETRKSLMTDAKVHGKGWLQKRGGMMDAEELDEMVTDQVPEIIWREWLNEQLNRGDWKKRNGYYVLN